MTTKAKQIFVNLPVKDLKRSIAFFTALGFEFNDQFTDENAACLIIGDQIYAMLLVHDFFRSFTKKDISNAAATTEVITALAVESREQVDQIVHKALEAGGKVSNDPQDHGFMYTWSFQDPDDHLWEVFYMNMNASQE
ncbi:glyoxalase/bleomycin resistance/extradiol dioxygenase family protein [Paenibacillus sp. HJL G12]|uniref:Glyoxalase/bleomycin resistance/extradiol dioxygenase family protein n=1 Tax=Paenibacillus dendrobii TaxID=2691084 RepID=A0A7X3LFG9_9BACL|nr:VOC family protein [Paenibacillus dendrobii]MWV42997.1 glyoxalase/bleomycin resistance/extradiol dioxygenase family protein [Paenibacillus dendrobii]